MKANLFFLLPLTIFSCNNTSSYKNTCYQCYYGNEVELSLLTNYDLSKNKIKMQNEIPGINDLDFFFDYYVLETEEEVNEFTSSNDFYFAEEDKEKLALKENHTEVVFIAQIPKNFRAFKRNNFQYQISNNEEIFLTSNFYTFNKRNDIAYCIFDVIKDDSITDNYLYSFAIKIDKSFYEYNKKTSVRGILSDSAYKNEDLPDF